MNPPFGVIFDMDGVMVDTLHGIEQSINDALHSENISFSETDHKRFQGVPWTVCVPAWNREFGLALDVDQFSARAFQFELKRRNHRYDLTDGLLTLLQKLSAAHVPLAVATASQAPRAHRILTLCELTPFFQVIVSSNDVQNAGKTEIFNETSKRLGIPPTRCVVIEDSRYGIEAAKAAHMKTIGYLGTKSTPQQLEKSDLLITHFDEIDYARLHALFK
jgi:HAD superfamily hydrolase (TIGR01509 family)